MLCRNYRGSRSEQAMLGEKSSLKTTLIAMELVAIVFMSGWLFTMYNTSITARQAVDQLLHRAYLDQVTLQLSIFGRSLNLLVLLLLFMFTTFLISTVTGRGRPGRR